MTTASSSPTTSTLLCQEHAQIGALTVIYRLYHRGNGFLMTVSDGIDTHAATLGTALRAATRFFFAVTDGCVTPCTFFDVLEDADDTGIFQKIPLQNVQDVL